MDDLATVEHLRSVALALAVVLVIWTNLRVFRDWPRWDRRNKVFRAHLNALLLVVGINLTLALTVEAVFVRLALLLLWEVSFVAWLYVSRHDDATNGVSS